MLGPRRRLFRGRSRLPRGPLDAAVFRRLADDCGDDWGSWHTGRARWPQTADLTPGTLEVCRVFRPFCSRWLSVCLHRPCRLRDCMPGPARRPVPGAVGPKMRAFVPIFDGKSLDGLGGQAGVLAGRGRRDRRRDDRRESDQGQHLPDLAGRASSMTSNSNSSTASAARQQRHPVPQPRPRRLRRRRLSGRLRGGHHATRASSTRSGAAASSASGASGSRSLPTARRRQASRSATPAELQEAIKPGRVERLPDRGQGAEAAALHQRPADVGDDRRAGWQAGRAGRARPATACRPADEGRVQKHPPRSGRRWPTAARSS